MPPQLRFVSRFIKTIICSPHSEGTVSVSRQRLSHILDGDSRGGGGGHRAGTGKPGKTEFPPGWDDAKIEQAIKEVAIFGQVKKPAHRVGELVIAGTVNGVVMEVIVEKGGEIRTAYPTSGLGVVKNQSTRKRGRT